MGSSLEKFTKWYIDPITPLRDNPDAGFIIMMIAFPLLERYLRKKLHLSERDKLSAPFHNELYCLFPEFGTVEHATQFWDIHRNGILHQTTPSEKFIPATPTGYSHEVKGPIEETLTGMFLIPPSTFIDRVLNTILGDFSTYEGGTSSPSLPLVQPYTTETGGVIEITISSSAGLAKI
jgi:hypothetical protein